MTPAEHAAWARQFNSGCQSPVLMLAAFLAVLAAIVAAAESRYGTPRVASVFWVAAVGLALAAAVGLWKFVAIPGLGRASPVVPPDVEEIELRFVAGVTLHVWPTPQASPAPAAAEPAASPDDAHRLRDQRSLILLLADGSLAVFPRGVPLQFGFRSAAEVVSVPASFSFIVEQGSERFVGARPDSTSATAPMLHRAADPLWLTAHRTVVFADPKDVPPRIVEELRALAAGPSSRPASSPAP